MTTYPDMLYHLGGAPVFASGSELPMAGTYFFVDSANGSDGNKGSWLRPFATIDYAIGRCTANKGDVIVVKPGHAETLTSAAAITADIAGVSIIGLGTGTDMPEITLSSAAAASLSVTAANVTIRGIRFKCGIASMTAGLDLNAKDAKVEGCEFHESSATGLTWIDINGGSANACDRTKVINNRFYCTTAGNWDRAIELGEVADGVEIIGNVIIGDFDDAGIHNPTGKILTNLLIKGNYVRNDQAGQHAIELVSACTGAAIDNRLVTNAIATGFDAGALSCMGNLWNITTGGDSEGVPVNPTGDAATNYIGTNDADNEATTTLVAANEDGSVLERLEQIQEAINNGTGTAIGTNKSIVDLLGTNGTAITDSATSVLGVIGSDTATTAFASTNVVPNEDGNVLERLEQIQEAVNNGTGTSIATNKSLVDAIGANGTATITVTAGSLVGASGAQFIVQKSLTSSAILQSGVDVTGTATGGDIVIDDIIVETDATGLAAGTNFTIERDTGEGVLTFFAETVAALGANASERLATGSVTATGGPLTLKSGAKLVAKCTAMDCTGAGVVKLTILCRRVAAGATLAAA